MKSEAIAALREHLALTRSELGTLVGASEVEVGRWEGGSERPPRAERQRLDLLVRIAGRFPGRSVDAAVVRPTPPPRPEYLAVRARDIEAWSGSHEAPGALPVLVRRLVAATSPEALMRFPAFEGVRQPGWDGVVESPAARGHVPAGLSFWELSTNAGPQRKAEEDFRKRTRETCVEERCRGTFVAVTTRRWPRKDEWARSKRAGGGWASVLAFDADDLEAWMECSPAVAHWFRAGPLGRDTVGARDLESELKAWSAKTAPRLAHDVLLAGRGEEVAAVVSWVTAPPSVLVVDADTPEEALLFVAAVLTSQNEPLRSALLARTLVVSTRDAWADAVASTLEPGLVLLRATNDADAPQSAVDAGHHVIVPARGDMSPMPRGYAVCLRPFDRGALAQALERCGLDGEKAHRVAYDSGGKLASVMRLLRAPGDDSPIPPWARRPRAEALLPLLLLGAWAPECAGDREIARELSGDLDRLESACSEASRQGDAPVRRMQGAWTWRGRRDAWRLLSRYVEVDSCLFERFRGAVRQVLGAPAPSGAPWQQTEVGGYSGQLRSGLCEALLLLAVDGAVARPAEAERGVVAPIVRELLPRDSQAWRRLDRELGLLAEAAPAAFLDAAEDSLSDPNGILRLVEPPEVRQIGRTLHLGLLWALERLGWQPEHVGRVAIILGRLSARDPDTKLTNPPFRSLTELLAPERPQTAANAATRLGALEAVYRTCPEVGRRLLLASLPPIGGRALLDRPRPKWRAVAGGTDGAWPSAREYQEYVDEVANRALADVRERPDGWPELLRNARSVPEAVRSRLVDALASLQPSALASELRLAIWQELRRVLHFAYSFPDDRLRYDDRQVRRLAHLYEMFAPDEPSLRYGWLFGWADLPEKAPDCWQDKAARRAERQREAFAHVLAAAAPMREIVALAARAEAPRIVGAVAAEMVDEALAEELLAFPWREHDPDVRFWLGFVSARASARGAGWLVDICDRLHAEGRIEDVVDALLLLPQGEETWDCVARHGQPVSERYWQKAADYSIPSEGSAWRRATTHLRAVGRAAAAVHVAAEALRKRAAGADEDDVMTGLEAVEALVDGGDGAWRTEPDPYLVSDSVQQVLGHVHGAASVPDDRLVRLEWRLLDSLARRDVVPRATHRRMARDPAYFVDVVARAQGPVRGDGPSSGDAPRAERSWVAWELLRKYPGGAECTYPPAPDALGDWTDRALQLAEARGLRAPVIEAVAEVLAQVPNAADGCWPCERLRVLLEELQQEDATRVTKAVFDAVRNGRGMTVRFVTEGGDQKRTLVDRYDASRRALAGRFPRAAALAGDLAESYRRDAADEDRRVEPFRDP